MQNNHTYWCDTYCFGVLRLISGAKWMESSIPSLVTLLLEKDTHE